jgi:pimeloyl-ACP methyl ester carboxylesterase
MVRTRLMAARLGWEPRWFNPHLEKWLHRVKIPALVLWGAEDKLLPAAYAEVWKKRLPDVRCDVIAACGHSPHVEQMEQVLARMGAFWREIGA